MKTTIDMTLPDNAWDEMQEGLESCFIASNETAELTKLAELAELHSLAANLKPQLKLWTTILPAEATAKAKAVSIIDRIDKIAVRYSIIYQ